MATSINRTQLLGEASRAGRFGSKASLQAAGVPTRQHNLESTAKKPKTKAKTQKTAAPKKAAVSKSTAAKKPAKKAAAKSTTTKKS